MMDQLQISFSVKHRAAIVECIRKTSGREAFTILLGYINKMLSVTQHCDQSKIAIPEKVREHGTAVMLHYKTGFPFAMITPCVHQTCAHSWELFEMTKGKLIAIYGEHGHEAWNKHIEQINQEVLHEQDNFL